MPISWTQSHFESNFRKPLYSFGKEIALFPLVFLRNLYSKSKTNLHFIVKFLRKKQRLLFWLFGESSCLNICTLWYAKMKFMELNWFCKHIKKIRSSQDSNSTSFCTELKLFALTIVEQFTTQEKDFTIFSNTRSNYWEIIYQKNVLHLSAKNWKKNCGINYFL